MYSLKDRIYWQTLPVGTVITRFDYKNRLVYRMRIVQNNLYLVEQFPSLLGIEGEEYYNTGIFHSIFDERKGIIVVQKPRLPKPIDWI